MKVLQKVVRLKIYNVCLETNSQKFLSKQKMEFWIQMLPQKFENYVLKKSWMRKFIGRELLLYWHCERLKKGFSELLKSRQSFWEVLNWESLLNKFENPYPVKFRDEKRIFVVRPDQDEKRKPRAEKTASLSQTHEGSTLCSIPRQSVRPPGCLL